MKTSTVVDGRTAAVSLAHYVQSNVADAALVFPCHLVEETMKELKEGIPLIHFAPWHDFQVPYALSFFLGATFSGNQKESEHLHPAQAELYLPVKGLIQVKCWYGKHHCQYTAGPGDALLIPPGRWHFVEWAEPGWCWVVKGPNNLQGDAAKVTRMRS